MNFFNTFFAAAKSFFKEKKEDEWSYETMFEHDYRETAAALIHGDTDDFVSILNSDSKDDLSDGTLKAISDFQELSKHLIEIGKDQQRAQYKQAIESFGNAYHPGFR